ncbi:hypothetical protein D3C77_419210 [compost metagenome]
MGQLLQGNIEHACRHDAPQLKSILDGTAVLLERKLIAPVLIDLIHDKIKGLAPISQPFGKR